MIIYLSFLNGENYEFLLRRNKSVKGNAFAYDGALQNKKEGFNMKAAKSLLKGRRTQWGIAFASMLLATVMCFDAAYAELQNVQVGGEMRIRGRWYINTWQDGGRATRISNGALGKRPIGPTGVSSLFKWDDKGSDWTRYESSVLLNVKADFTEDVTAFFELYDWHIWGEDFRSRDYLTGFDTRANSSDDIEINQAYVEARDIYGYPIRLRVGRQNLKFGKGWLVTDMLTPSQYVSHDAIRFTYEQNDLTVDAFASKLTENIVGDDDVDFYGVYGTYSGMEALSLSAYWFFLRDGRTPDNTPGSAPVLDWFEDLLDKNQYGATQLHTVGLRANGRSSGFDYDLELSYQFGEAHVNGAGFVPVGLIYGDDDAEYDSWAGDLTVGYTFEDVKFSPRVYLQGAYFGGEDNRDISFGEWLNPFDRPEASVSFNRLFTDRNYMPTVNDNGWMSNFCQLQSGVEFKPSEKVKIHFHVARNWFVEPFDPPVSVKLGGKKIPIAPGLSFWTTEGSDDIGWEAACWVKYDYSKDLWFLLYGNYLWPDDGLTDGGFAQFNGTDFTGGTDDDDAAYIFWMSVLRF